MGVSDYVNLSCPHCGKAGRIAWGEALDNSGKRRIGSLSEGFMFVADGLTEPRIECESCHHVLGGLQGLIAGCDHAEPIQQQSN